MKYFTVSLSIIILILLIHTLNAASIYTPKERESNSSNEDQYYLVFIDHKIDNKSSFLFTENDEEHNDKKEEIINSIIQKIHQLILDNKSTYHNPGKLEELDSNAKYHKRFQTINKNVDSNYIYLISSLEDSSLLYGYLSGDIAEMVKKIPNVKACQQTSYMKRANYEEAKEREEEILKETGWSNLSMSEDVYNHLSIISQGKYDDQLVSKYDTTYYYPSSAGKDIDVYVFDDYFNFNDQEYQQQNDDHKRVTKCLFNVTNTMIYPLKYEKSCMDPAKFDNYHGALTTDAVGGKLNGVANQSNLYGVYLPYDPVKGFSTADQIAALDYIRKNLLKPHKSVFNFSFGRYSIINHYDEDILYLEKLVNEMSKEGAIFVASAGNDGYIAYDEEVESAFVPCVFDNVICVGAIDNRYSGQVKVSTSNYKKAYFSNYGKGVDIYAPGYARLRYRDKENLISRQTVYGTSFSSPIVSGVIATLMSEFNDTEFTQESMFDYIKKIGIKNAITDIPLNETNNLLINNGKHVVYSANGKYYGCSINSGNQKCEIGQCCNSESYCEISENGDGNYCKKIKNFN